MTTTTPETIPLPAVASAGYAAPAEPYLKLFLRFLRFGALAWGGPVAQIAMIRQELVEEEKWISRERFNRVLAVYQVLPGPEAHEMCVYFGMQARGRLGGFLAGLGFMLPGLVLMLALAWLYVEYGIKAAGLAGAFYGMQAAVGAVVVRAVHRIGSHALHDRQLVAIATGGFVLQLAGVSFVVTLFAAGALYALFRLPARKTVVGLAGAALILVVVGGLIAIARGGQSPSSQKENPALPHLFESGLRSGLLTFGGAYTVIPYLREDAVVTGGWMSDAQFLDGLALSGILPAPLVIFGTFVGYIGAGWGGALVLTAGIFLPAFAFTLIGHRLMERLIANAALHHFLDGVTAGVVGLIGATALVLLQDAIADLPALLIFGGALLILYRRQSKLSVPAVVGAAALAGLLVTAL